MVFLSYLRFFYLIMTEYIYFGHQRMHLHRYYTSRFPTPTILAITSSIFIGSIPFQFLWFYIIPRHHLRCRTPPYMSDLVRFSLAHGLSSGFHFYSMTLSTRIILAITSPIFIGMIPFQFLWFSMFPRHVLRCRTTPNKLKQVRSLLTLH